MAKQTFTTGQVLTAAQMTSLQETAMGGGPATAKTASYVLVAADAGTTVAMNAAGATTITVNTGLFAAGDTVFIQNLGAGACTVTAGTATVATAGSLILPQNDAGILYFTATGAAIFYDYIQAGAVSPLTTKGDVYGFSTSDARIPIGANDTVLTADSTQSLGLKWATPASGGMTLLSTTSLSGTTTNITGISGSYVHLFFQLIEVDTSVGAKIKVNLNAGQLDSICAYSADQVDANSSGWGSKAADISNNLCAAGWIYNYAYSGIAGTSVIMHGGSANTGTSSAFLTVGLFGGTAPVTEINVTTDAGTATFTTGSIKIWGVK